LNPQMVTHTSTNRARCTLTTLNETSVQTATVAVIIIIIIIIIIRRLLMHVKSFTKNHKCGWSRFSGCKVQSLPDAWQLQDSRCRRLCL